MFSGSNRESSTGTNLMVFLLGAAVGACCAILYAPASGTETRAQIAEKAGQAKDKVVEMKDTVVDKATQWKDMAASRLTGAADTAMDAMNDGKSKSDKPEKTHA